MVENPISEFLSQIKVKPSDPAKKKCQILYLYNKFQKNIYRQVFKSKQYDTPAKSYESESVLNSLPVLNVKSGSYCGIRICLYTFLLVSCFCLLSMSS